MTGRPVVIRVGCAEVNHEYSSGNAKRDGGRDLTEVALGGVGIKLDTSIHLLRKLQMSAC